MISLALFLQRRKEEKSGNRGDKEQDHNKTLLMESKYELKIWLIMETIKRLQIWHPGMLGTDSS